MKQIFSIFTLAILALVLHSWKLQGQQPGTFVTGTESANVKVCVAEPKHNTTKVYAAKCEEYCLPSCSLLSLFKDGCVCGPSPCAELKIRHRLVVRTIDAADS